MSTGSSGPPGVKNLRAMFENKNSDLSTSPPSRGRSPNESTSSSTSRPVSKVRTSFVVVERAGESGQPTQWGLRKTSDVSAMAELREEAIMEEQGGAATKSVKEDAQTSTGALGLGAILKGSPFEALPEEQEKKVTDLPKVNGHTNKVGPIVAKIQSEAQPQPQPLSKAEATAPATKVPRSVNTKATASKSKDSPTQAKTSPTISEHKESAIKPRGGVSKITGIIQSANKAKEERAKVEQAVQKTSPRDIKPPPAVSKLTPGSKVHIQEDDESAEPTQVKSPTATRPTKLPSVATATTAASKARKSVSSHLEEPKAALSDRKSLNVLAPRVASITTKASLAKKSSRASLVNGDEQPRSRISTVHKPADESVLARLTRPTAASQQRAQEKVHLASPPRPRNGLDGPKKPVRKSLNIQPREHRSVPATEDETILEPVTGRRIQTASVLSEDLGEPGPAEESAKSPQPAEAKIAL